LLRDEPGRDHGGDFVGKALSRPFIRQRQHRNIGHASTGIPEVQGTYQAADAVKRTTRGVAAINVVRSDGAGTGVPIGANGMCRSGARLS
jgi:hypothetical protein